MSRFLCIGHRGACGYEPENTLRSFRRALDLGADGLELDVQLSGGELVVFHDAKLERTTNGRGPLRRKSFADLRRLDAGHGEQIPTLREVIDTVARRAFLNIELKGRRTARPVAALLAEYLARGWEPNDFLISSFLRRELKDFREAADSRIPLGLLLVRPTRLWLRSARALGVSAVHPPLRYVRAGLVEKAHEHGLEVFVYTVNTPESIARMRSLGVDGVFTDFPDRIAREPGESSGASRRPQLPAKTAQMVDGLDDGGE